MVVAEELELVNRDVVTTDSRKRKRQGRAGLPCRQEEGPMDQAGVSEPEPLVAAVDVTLIEGAARDLEDFGEEPPTKRGHRPSWAYPQVPDGLALCVGCWRPIAAQQLGGELCPGSRKAAP